MLSLQFASKKAIARNEHVSRMESRTDFMMSRSFVSVPGHPRALGTPSVAAIAAKVNESRRHRRHRNRAE
jgi:hypothetical protein